MRQTGSPQSSPGCQLHPADWITAAAPAVLNQVVDLQVALQDVVLHRVEDESNVFRVRGAREVGVDDFFLVRIEADKHV